MPPYNPKHIVCVDDEQDFWELLMLWLPGYAIKPVATVAEAFRSAKTQFFDLYFFLEYNRYLPV